MYKFCLKQKGATLILVTFIIALAATAYLLRAYDPLRLSLEQDRRTYLELNEAKSALIAWSASHSIHPGQMPFPDRNADGNYDGKSDCNSPVSTFSYSFLVGQLPVFGQDNPCIMPQIGLGNSYQDAQGNRFWYAVSRNIVHKYESPSADPIINPNIVNNPVYPWLVVKDRNGAVISNRVAVVIFAPGNTLTGQNRATIAPNIVQYLDTFQIGATTLSNADYDSADEDFIIGQDGKSMSDADNSVTKPYYFNDKLVYITIDELLRALTYRARGDVAKLLNDYRSKNGQFPYAANLGASLNNHNSSGVATNGMLPIDVTDSCGCSSDTSCSCSFNPIVSVTMFRNAGTWNSTEDLGLCSSLSSSKSCTCTGAGSCSRFGTVFSCTALGECTHNLPATPQNKYTYTVNDYADFNNATVGCSVMQDVLPKDTVECNSSGSFTIGLRESAWFKTNLWQDYFYYHWSPTNDLQVGTKLGVSAILLSAGEPIINLPFSIKGAPQVRPSLNLDDYLDSMENINGDNIFDATNRVNTNDYNDQIFVVAP